MAFNFGDLANKYKIHSETESFFKARGDEGAQATHELSVEDARAASESAAEKYAGTVEFEGKQMDFLVPSIYNKGKISGVRYM